MFEVYEDQINVKPLVVGKVLEDTRHGSPTQGDQFEIEDVIDGVVTLRKLEEDEYLVPMLVWGRIVK
jgi:hypothetical protein